MRLYSCAWGRLRIVEGLLLFLSTVIISVVVDTRSQPSPRPTTSACRGFGIKVTNCAFIGFSLSGALRALRGYSIRCLYVGSFRLPFGDASRRVTSFRRGLGSGKIANCTIKPVCVGARRRVSGTFRCTGQIKIGLVINIPGCSLLPCLSGGIGRCSFGCTVRLRNPSVPLCPSTSSI